MANTRRREGQQAGGCNGGQRTIPRPCGWSLLLLLALGGCDLVKQPTALPEATSPLASVSGGGGDGRYIVLFGRNEANPQALAQQLVAQAGGKLHYTYRAAVKGFAATLPARAVEALRSNPHVVALEPDRDIAGDEVVQTAAPWGLDRIDQRMLPRDGLYRYVRTGRGVSVYILDSGIMYEHQEFGGRAHFGTDVFTDTLNKGGADCNGHGTAVASIAGGGTFGVAKEVDLYSVRVLNCSNAGKVSGAIAGVDWVTANAHRPAVANMSLSVTLDTTGISAALEQAVLNSIAAGIAYSVSVSNGNRDACTVSPARVPEAMSSAGSDSIDRRMDVSDFGPCVDWYAPAVRVPAAAIGSTTASAVRSGTSYAAPHTAGAAALYLETNPAARPAQVQEALRSAATTNAITGVPSGTNALLYTLANWSSPVATIVTPAPGLQVLHWTPVAFTGSATDVEDGTLPGASLAWSSDIDGPLGTGSTLTRSDLTVGVHTITLSATDAGGATGTATVSLVVNTLPPVARITAPASGTLVNVGSNVAFLGSGTDPETGALSGTALVWTSSLNGQIGTGGSFSTTALAAGAQTITLTATDPLGATGSASISLLVNTGPAASFTYSCSGATCSFVDRTADAESNVVTRSWTFGKAGTSTVKDPTFTFTERGTYPVKLDVLDAGGLASRANLTVQCKAVKNVLSCS